MAQSIQLKVVTPNGSLLDEEVRSFTASSDMGEFCVLPEHRPILAALAAGRMLVEQLDGSTRLFALGSGFIEGGMDHVSVITENCIPAEKLDKAALAKEVADLEKELADLDRGAPEVQDTVKTLEWAQIRLALAE